MGGSFGNDLQGTESGLQRGSLERSIRPRLGSGGGDEKGLLNAGRRTVQLRNGLRRILEIRSSKVLPVEIRASSHNEKLGDFNLLGDHPSPRPRRQNSERVQRFRDGRDTRRGR